MEVAGVDGRCQWASVMNQTVEVRRTPDSSESIQNTLGTSHTDQPVMHKNHIRLIGLPYHSRTMPESTPRHAANLLDLDFHELPKNWHPPAPIIDVHSHIHGTDAVRCYREIAAAYGITLTYSMTPLPEVETVRQIMGDRIRFIATPEFGNPDRKYAHGKGYQERIREFHRLGSRIVKFWAAPRGRDYGEESGDRLLLDLSHPERRAVMDVASELGMMFMTHIADPDTWFKTRYSDSSFYGTKLEQYESLEAALDTYSQPWIAAHMGGWPENLPMLDGLLERHDNLYLDTSATKWVVRELSKHPRDVFIDFLQRWKGRILFGSDIVTRDEHFAPPVEDNPDMPPQATSPEEAWDLYASRYWALRTLFESDYDGPSPIADPDLMMVEPERYGPLDSPNLKGHSIPESLLKSIYHDAAMDLLEPLES